MPTRVLRFAGADGTVLSGRLDLPADGLPRGYALFAHCFTCGKSLKPVVNLSRAMTACGLAVLRFDFTGLGESEGDFAETTFSSNVSDLLAAADFLGSSFEAPQVLVGHSLGGAAVLHAAKSLASVRAVVTIGAPSEPDHVLHLLSDSIGEIEARGTARVEVGGRSFQIKRDFLADLDRTRMTKAAEGLGRPLLIMHSPIDQIVGIENAQQLYHQARHPKSFVSLDRADHLLTDPRDSEYVGSVISAWAERYLDHRPDESLDALAEQDRVVVRTGREHYPTDVLARGHPLLLDEPVAAGGQNLGPTPYDVLGASLGGCTSITLRMYADRKEWPLEEVIVRIRHARIHARDRDEDGRMDHLEREIELVGPLSEEQRARLLDIANRCPVHRSLEVGVKMTTVAREEGPGTADGEWDTGT